MTTFTLTFILRLFLSCFVVTWMFHTPRRIWINTFLPIFVIALIIRLIFG